MPDPHGHRRPEDPASPDTELPRIAAKLDAEVRADREEDERMAAVARLRARSLADVARELMVRGDEVAVHLGAASSSGIVSHAAGDLAVIRLAAPAAARLDVRLGSAALIQVVRTVRAGGTVPARGARSFLARLREHELSGTALRMHVVAASPVEGVLQAVASDHLLVRGRSGTWVLPLTQVCAVGYDER